MNTTLDVQSNVITLNGGDSNEDGQKAFFFFF